MKNIKNIEKSALVIRRKALNLRENEYNVHRANEDKKTNAHYYRRWFLNFVIE
ncbi:MAG: hypothetical protein I8H82_01740 [Rhodocyclales bacterium]|nr:hypothetical protein [Rhodocyclales bacterium]